MDKNPGLKKTGLPKLMKPTVVPKPVNQVMPVAGPSRQIGNNLGNRPILNPIGNKLIGMRRRSKSFTDLRQLNKPKAVPFEPSIPERVLSVNKRKGPKADEVVPKKQPKVQPWDFKTKFNLLSAEHKKCAEIRQKFKEQEVALATLQEEGEKLKISVESKDCQVTELTRKLEESTRQLKELTTKYNVSLKEEAHNRKTIETLRNDLLANDIVRKSLHNHVQELKGNIRVYCRVRPALNSEQELPQCQIQFGDDQISLGLNKQKMSSYKFDTIFAPECCQKVVFEELAYLVQSAVDGYNVCIFAYGQTGSGKTYTMLGSMKDDEELGMIPRSVNLLFDLIEKSKRSHWSYSVKASFYEVYNECIQDLANECKKNLKLRHHKGVSVDNLTEFTVETASELQELIQGTQSNRRVATTHYNAKSSRSHAITKISLKGINPRLNISTEGSITLVDLAGSESAKTSLSEKQLTETKNINSSLMQLGHVMQALYQKRNHIPYRNSKLTELLAASLGGDSKTLMIVNIAPFELHLQENINALRFASTVKEVRTGLKVKKVAKT